MSDVQTPEEGPVLIPFPAFDTITITIDEFVNLLSFMCFRNGTPFSISHTEHPDKPGDFLIRAGLGIAVPGVIEGSVKQVMGEAVIEFKAEWLTDTAEQLYALGDILLKRLELLHGGNLLAQEDFRAILADGPEKKSSIIT